MNKYIELQVSGVHTEFGTNAIWGYNAGRYCNADIISYHVRPRPDVTRGAHFTGTNGSLGQPILFSQNHDVGLQYQ